MPVVNKPTIRFGRGYAFKRGKIKALMQRFCKQLEFRLPLFNKRYILYIPSFRLHITDFRAFI